MIDGYLNFMCLYLQYQFSSKLYKILCRRFHGCFSKLMHNIVKNRLKKEIELNKVVMSNDSNPKETELKHDGNVTDKELSYNENDTNIDIQN